MISFIRSYLSLFTFSILSCILTVSLSADVKGLNGIINFDRNSNGQADMKLDATGLSLSTTAATANLDVSGNAIITQQLIIGTSSSQSNLHIQGTVGFSQNETQSDVTIGEHMFNLLDTSSDNLVAVLPYAGNVSGRIYQIKKTSESNHLWVEGGGNLIDAEGVLEFSAAANTMSSIKVVSDGQQWYILEGNSDEYQTVASENLVGWYRFDESSGTIAQDSSRTNQSGSLSAGLTFPGESSPVHRGLSFNGTSDTIDAGNHADHNFGEGDFSVCFWAYRNSNVTTNLRALSKGGQTDSAAMAGFSFFGSDTGLSFAINPGGARSYSNMTISVGEWIHVVGLLERGVSRRLYKNGVEVDNDPSIAGSISGVENFRLGSGTGPNLYWDGKLDDIRLYNKALSVSEITEIFQMGQ